MEKKSVLQNRFQAINNLKRNYRGVKPLMDFGIGEEKSKPTQDIINKLIDSLALSETHKYADNGLEILKQQCVRYLKESFNIQIETMNIAITMGAKSALSILPFLLCQKGDTVIVTKPGYIIFQNVCRLNGIEVYEVELKPENGFLPDLDKIPVKVLKKTKVFQINYPNNPTGVVATEEFYLKLNLLAEKYGFYIVNDAAYLGLSFDNPVSLFSIGNKKDNLIEIYTLSKSHNMTGYRIGFLIASPEVVNEYERMKDNFESGQFLPIQYAAVEALSNGKITRRLRKQYILRSSHIYNILYRHGLNPIKPGGTFFILCHANKKLGASQMAISLLNEYGIATIPYEVGEGYIRFSMTFSCENDDLFYEDFENRIIDFTSNYK